MEREAHEQLLTELLSPELEQSRRTEILQNLRTDYGTVTAEHDELSKKVEKLQHDNDDLIISNSKLFRQVGIVGGNEDQKKKEEQKSFSETVTIEQLEKQ